MWELWNHHKWNRQPLDEKFRAECQEWLDLLLNWVHVTMPNAPMLLRKFFAQRQGILLDSTFKSYVTEKVIQLHCIMHLTLSCYFLV